MRGEVKTELARLARLTKMLRDKELGELEQKAREVVRLENRIAELNAASLWQVPDPGGMPDPASLAGQDMRYRAWASAEIARFNTELARARSEREAQLIVSRQAFGRDEAVGELIEVENRDALTRKARVQTS